MPHGRHSGRVILSGQFAKSKKPLNMDSNAQQRELGMAVRQETLSILQGKDIFDTIRSISSGEAAIELPCRLREWLTQAVLKDMEQDSGWSEECWKLDPKDEAIPVSSKEFWNSENNKRFSWNECLRKPLPEAYALRGFLSALVSPEVYSSLSKAFGEDVKFKSADMARYRKSHYLKRHADLFENRRFGFIWFFNDDWDVGDGGELVVESASGSAISIPPRRGTIAAILIRPGYYHQVAANRSESWVRYSVASHYYAT